MTQSPIEQAINFICNLYPDMGPDNGSRHKEDEAAHIVTALRQHQQNVKAVYYCEHGQSLDGLEQGAMAVLANLMMKTNADTADFMIGNENDGEFHFSCKRTPPAPKKENDDERS